MINCFEKSKKFQPQFQLIYLETNVDQNLTHGRIRLCFKVKEQSLISKYQLLVLSKAKKSSSSFKFIFTLTRIKQSSFIKKRSTSLVSFKNFKENSKLISNLFEEKSPVLKPGGTSCFEKVIIHL